MKGPSTEAGERAERVLARHGVADERTTRRQGPRPKRAIDAIIRDVKQANAEAED